jgi:putative FmdB family regulatory protein
MPYYDYECVKCHKQFEIQQHMVDPEFKIYDHLDRYCCRCNGPVVRMISAAALKFVGKGFHINDYPKNGKR